MQTRSKTKRQEKQGDEPEIVEPQRKKAKVSKTDHTEPMVEGNKETVKGRGIEDYQERTINLYTSMKHNNVANNETPNQAGETQTQNTGVVTVFPKEFYYRDHANREREYESKRMRQAEEFKKNPVRTYNGTKHTVPININRYTIIQWGLIALELERLCKNEKESKKISWVVIDFMIKMDLLLDQRFFICKG